MTPKDRLIVALDVDTEDKALALVRRLRNDVKIFKIGLELFSSCGPAIVERVKREGCEVFLDLKFHDIPNTVSKAAASVTRLGAFIFNLHALGGFEMMKKAAETVKREAGILKIARPKVIAVTILTSMDEKSLKGIGINDNIESEVTKLAKMAEEAGLDGVVASPKEIKAIRKIVKKDFLIVTPGVRPAWAEIGDQKRIATPKDAIKDGADYIVVGRPIIESDDPCKAAQAILNEIS